MLLPPVIPPLIVPPHVQIMSQDICNNFGSLLRRLTIYELFSWCLMLTNLACITRLWYVALACSHPLLALLQVQTMSQEIRNDVGSLLLRLTIRELFSWRFMQTDPNWGNFLYDEHSDQLHLIDFGAAKEYPKPFVDEYLRMVLACADKNRDAVIRHSTNLHFLTGVPLMLFSLSCAKLFCNVVTHLCKRFWVCTQQWMCRQ